MRVIVADDARKFRDRQVQELRELGVEVVAEAAGEDELLVWVRRCHPDAVLLDINFSNHRGDWDAAGISAAVRLRQLHADLAIVMLSSQLSQAYLELITAIDGGVAYLGKDTCGDGATIVQALRQAIAGKKFIDPALTARMMGAPRMQPILSALTRRQREALGYAAQGYSNKAIARFMSVQESTVAATLNDAFRKLEIPQSDDVNTRVRGVTAWLGIAGIPPAEPWPRDGGS